MARFIYLLVDLDDGSVKGTDDAELLQQYVHDEQFVIIVTTGPTQSYLVDGADKRVQELKGNDADEDLEDEDEEDTGSDD